MPTYSFQDVSANYSGPGGNFTLANGAGASEEGVTIAMVDDKSTMVNGADGSVMHSLHAGKGGQVTVRLLKTSPQNSLMSRAYAFETASSALFGQSTITLRNPQTGDIITCRQCAWRKLPDLSYAKDGNTQEWAFNAGYVDVLLGSGAPALNF